MLDFLNPVSDPTDQHVATDPWWVAAIKSSPFAAKPIKTGVVQGVSWRVDGQFAWALGSPP